MLYEYIRSLQTLVPCAYCRGLVTSKHMIEIGVLSIMRRFSFIKIDADHTMQQ